MRKFTALLMQNDTYSFTNFGITFSFIIIDLSYEMIYNLLGINKKL